MVSIKRLYRLYKNTGLLNRIYVRIKVRICPLLKLEEFIPKKGKIADFGCGMGLFANIMALGSSERIIEGSDISGRKINVAEKTTGDRKNIRFSLRPIQNLNGSDYDAIIISDTLYLIPSQQQEQILRDCFRKLTKDGLLLIKEMNTKPYWKYLLNLIQETLIVKILKFTQGDNFFFHSSSEYKNLLSRIGFEIKVIRLDKEQIYPHIAYICNKQ